MSACGRSRVLLSARALLAPPPAVRQFASRTLSSSACVFSVADWRKTLVSGCRAELASQSSGRTCRNLSATAASFLNQLRPLSCYDPLDLGEVEENTRKALTCKHLRRFIIDPELARTVTEHLTPDIEEGKAIILECNPGVCVKEIKIEKFLFNLSYSIVVILLF